MSDACPLYRVDAFATERFTGNSAAVCLLPAGVAQTLGSQGLQAIAAELNQPATCFVSLLKPADTFAHAEAFALKWFSPSTELPLCGHGTLATAAVLFQEAGAQHDTLRFETLKGQVTVQRLPDVPSGLPLIQLGLPRSSCTKQLPSGLKLNATNLQVVIGSLPIRDIQYSENVRNALVVLGYDVTRTQLESMQPDMQSMLSSLSGTCLNGVMVTCRGGSKPYHFLSRYFAPWLGIGEDAVTGSAHTALGPYWAAQLNMFGQPMQARQCSKRGGDVQVTVHQDDSQVLLASTAVILSSGKLNLVS